MPRCAARRSTYSISTGNNLPASSVSLWPEQPTGTITMTNVWRCLRAWSVPVFLLGLVACSNGRGSLEDSDGGQQQQPGKVTIGGTVAGLAGPGLVLQNNGGDDVGVQSDGGFAFATKIPSGSPYNVTVKTHPASPPQACSVQNGAGSVANADVENVVITCVTREFTIGGTLSGLRGSGLVLANNGSDFFSPTADGPFTFPTAVVSGRPYNVTVQSPPSRPLPVCRVFDGSGVVSDTNVTNITVN